MNGCGTKNEEFFKLSSQILMRFYLLSHLFKLVKAAKSYSVNNNSRRLMVELTKSCISFDLVS